MATGFSSLFGCLPDIASWMDRSRTEPNWWNRKRERVERERRMTELKHQCEWVGSIFPHAFTLGLFERIHEVAVGLASYFPSISFWVSKVGFTDKKTICCFTQCTKVSPFCPSYRCHLSSKLICNLQILAPNYSTFLSQIRAYRSIQEFVAS